MGTEQPKFTWNIAVSGDSVSICSVILPDSEAEKNRSRTMQWTGSGLATKYSQEPGVFDPQRPPTAPKRHQKVGQPDKTQ